MAAETPQQQQEISSTPILDGERPFRARSSAALSRGQIVLVLVGLAIPVAVPTLLLLAGFEGALTPLEAFSRFMDRLFAMDRLVADVSRRPVEIGAYVIASWYCVVAVHELGHLLAGRLAGFKFQWMSIGPVRFAVNGGRLVLQLQKANWQGGFTAMLPPADLNSRKRWFFMVMGGAVANLVFAFVLELAVQVVPGLPTDAQLPLHSLALFSGAIAVLSLVPYSPGVLVQDGSRLLILLADGPKARRWFALVSLQNALAAGQRYRDWDFETVQLAASVPDKSADDISGTALAYVYECDRRNAVQASRHLEHLLDCAQSVASVRAVFVSEACFFQAWHKRDPQRAHLWWERGSKTRKKLPSHARLREQAGLLFVQGQYSEAMQKIDESLQEIRKMPASPQRSVLEQNWLEWKDDLLARQREAQMSAHIGSAT